MSGHDRYFWIKSNGGVEEVSRERASKLGEIPEMQRIAQRGGPKHQIIIADFTSVSLRNSRELNWATLDIIRHKLLEGKGVGS